MKNPFSKKAPSQQEGFLRTYLDRIAPGIVKFEVDHYIFGSTYRCVWALREYPASTEAQALLRELGEKSGVTLRIYCRQVSPGEEDRIIDNANKKNKLDGSDPNKLRQAVAAESNLRDVAELVHKMHREHEPLVHCAVYLEMTADSKERLRQLQTDVLTELVRCKLNVDKLLLRQKQGFCCQSCGQQYAGPGIRAGTARRQRGQSLSLQLLRQDRSQRLLHWERQVRQQHRGGL